MEINLNTLKDQDFETTTVTNEMKISNRSQGMIFRLFTKNIYSNPIGTIVREITSNCFDSHIEANVDLPVIIRKWEEPVSRTNFISFIDFGMGMSPERISNVYGVYLESTKRDNNNQIGGWGIGGKTPLAYHRFYGLGEHEYDNSYSIITNYNGVKYHYTIMENIDGVPIYSLLNEESTTDRNGTEIRIEILSKDINKFENEIINQLYYFENIVFEGFSSQINNDYKIYKGESILYRSSNNTRFNNTLYQMHICLGRVTYPIDWSAIQMRSISLPIALKFDVGELSVTLSRENLDYNQKAIQLIKDKINDAIAELNKLLNKQNSSVVTYIDYIKNQNSSSHLIIDSESNYKIDLSDILKTNNVSFVNFKYNDIKIVYNSYNFFEKLFDVKIFGKNKINRRNANQLTDNSIIHAASKHYYYCDNANYNLSLTKASRAYINKVTNNMPYAVVTRNMYGVNSVDFLLKLFSYDVWVDPKTNISWAYYKTLYNIKDIDSAELLLKCDENAIHLNTFVSLAKGIVNEIIDYVKNNFRKIDDLIVTDEFISQFKEKSKVIHKQVDNTVFPIKIITPGYNYHSEKVTYDKLSMIKGTIYYCLQDDIEQAQLYAKIYTKYSVNKKLSCRLNDLNGLFIIQASKSNIAKISKLPNSKPLSYFPNDILRRVIDKINEKKSISKIANFWHTNSLENHAFLLHSWGCFINKEEHSKAIEIEAIISKYRIDSTKESECNYILNMVHPSLISQNDDKKNDRIFKYMNYMVEMKKTLDFIYFPYRWSHNMNNEPNEEDLQLISIIKKILD